MNKKSNIHIQWYQNWKAASSNESESYSFVGRQKVTHINYIKLMVLLLE